jgi:hypothetical protein
MEYSLHGKIQQSTWYDLKAQTSKSVPAAIDANHWKPVFGHSLTFDSLDTARGARFENGHPAIFGASGLEAEFRGEANLW